MPAHILVVDDEPDLELLVRQKFRKKIRDGTWTFSFAHDGFEALDHLSAHREIEIVLTDLNMPGMDGLTLLGRMGELDRLLKAVVVTAYGDMPNIRTAMNRGAFDFIIKPIDFDDLDATIDKACREVEAFKQAAEGRRQWIAMQRELEVARRIQEAVLLQTFPDRPGVELGAHMAPAREVGGDFYDVYPIDDHRIGVAIGDVSGKGVSAALFMAVSRTLLKGLVMRGTPPDETLTAMNRLLYPQSLPHMFVTVFYGVLDRRTGRLDYCNAGHNSPYLVHANGTLDVLPRTRSVAVSLLAEFSYLSGSVTLEPGDAVLLFTDGVVEARSPEREEFETERLEAVLRASAGLPVSVLVESVAEAVTTFANGTPPTDDVTLLALRYMQATG